MFNVDAASEAFKCTKKFAVFGKKGINSSQAGWDDLFFNVEPTPGDASRAKVDVYGDLTVHHPSAAPDYVFAEDYQLKSIEELAAYIEANHHLPGVKSAQEFETQGVNTVNTMWSLLEKIEELTLYTIAQEKALEEKDEQLAEVLQRLKALEDKMK